MDDTAVRPGSRPHHRTRGVRHALIAVLLIALVVLVGSPLRLVALVGSSGSTDRSPTSVPHVLSDVPDELGPIRTEPASVTSDVTDSPDDGPRAPSASSGPGGIVTEGRWGAAPGRPEGLELLLEEFRGGWRVEGGNEEAAAVAVIAAHAWADARRRPAATSNVVDGATMGAIVAVEAVERPGARHAVVTALVAPEGAAGALHRIAVPIVMDLAGPSVAGEPWLLPAPMLQVPSFDGVPITDPDLIASARRALDAVGLPGERLIALEATDGWPFIARLDDALVADPWLRWHLDRFVVAGLPLARAGSAPP
jgi:hypothetical protein